MPWQGESKRSSRGLSLRIGAVESGYEVSVFLGGEWALSRLMAYACVHRSAVFARRARFRRGHAVRESRRGRTTCPRQLFAEESSVAVSSTVDGDRGIADATSLQVLSQTAGTGLVAVRSKEAGSVPFWLRL